MGSVWLDARYALRRLSRNPGFSGIAVLTLALGIGASSTIFSVVNAVLLRPLPFPDPGRLVAVTQVSSGTRAGSVPVSFTKFEAIREQATSLADLAVYYSVTLSLGGGSEPEQIAGARVSGDLFGLLRTKPALGRGFLPDEEAPGGADVALISDGLWRRRFGGDPGLLGGRIRLDGKDVTVVGVLPRRFRFPLEAPEPEIWLPRVSEPDFLTPAQVHSGASYLAFVARLREGETIGRAQAELATIDARYRRQYGSYVDATRFELRAASLEDTLEGSSRRPLFVLLGAVGFVLLIACANVASLQLAGASARLREMAVRRAMGAPRSGLVRQMLIESLLLSLLGGALGVLLASWAVPLAQRVAAGSAPRLEQSRVDGVVLLFSLGLCCATGLAFGIVPALHASRGDLQDALRDGGRGSTDGAARRRLRALFVAEAAVALVLVTGAGLLIRSLAGLVSVDPGFDPQGVMVVPIALPASRYAEPARQARFYRELLERVRGLPGVKAAAAVSDLPLAGVVRFVFFCPEGHACQGIGKDPVIVQRQVTPGYFETLRTPVVRGRVFAATDTASSAPVVIVNQATARRYWPGADPIGKHLANSRDRVEREVVGVVADAKVGALDAPDVEEMDLPLAQSPRPSMTLLVRADSEGLPLAAAVRREIARLDGDVAVPHAQSMGEVVAASIAQRRLVMRVVAAFATLALLLAAVGIYGVMSFSVAGRVRELGVRMALGARPRDVLRLLLREGLGLTLAGVALGLVSSLALTRVLAGLLFGVSAADPLTFASAAVVLTASALAACWVPAVRGMRLQPIRALRHE
jgi:putative ABC transport system permease protein